MVVPDIHTWDIERVQYRNNKKGSCCMERIVSRFKCFDTWWVKSHEDFDRLYHDMYISRMSYALNVMSIYQNDS